MNSIASFFSNFLALSGVLLTGILNELHFSNLLKNSNKEVQTRPSDPFFPNTLTALWKSFLLKRFLKYFSFNCDISEVRCWCTPLSEYDTSVTNLMQSNRGKCYGTWYTVKLWVKIKTSLQFSSTNFSVPKQNKDLKTAVTILCHHIPSMLSFALSPSALIVMVKETTIAISAVTWMGGEPSSSGSHDFALLFYLKLTVRAFCKQQQMLSKKRKFAKYFPWNLIFIVLDALPITSCMNP